jgi:hypothetical protein
MRSGICTGVEIRIVVFYAVARVSEEHITYIFKNFYPEDGGLKLVRNGVINQKTIILLYFILPSNFLNDNKILVGKAEGRDAWKTQAHMGE